MKLIAKIKSIVFPKNITCNICGSELFKASRYGLCDMCMAELEQNNNKICSTCGAPIYNEANFCIDCMNTLHHFDMCRSPLIYKGSAKAMIVGFKFSGKKYLAPSLGAMLADTYLKYGYKGDIIVPVPISATKLHHRGYNQSAELAQNLCNRLKLEYVEALAKCKETAEQVGLGRKEREKNLKGSFEVTLPVKGKRVVLIDDVLTTGATADECAETLLKAGAKSVEVLVVATNESRLLCE